MQVWCERDKIPMVFALCTFSRHEQEVDFGLGILCTVNDGGDELGSPALVLVPSEDIGTHYINNPMAQWRSWVSNIRPWTFTRSSPALIQKALARSHNTKVKSNTVSLITVQSQRGSTAVLAAVHHSELFPLLSRSLAEQRSQTQRQIEGGYTHRRTLQQQEGLKVTVFLKSIDKKVVFFVYFFSSLLTKWPFLILYEQLPDDAAGSRFIFRTRTLPGAFYIKAATLTCFNSRYPKRVFRWSSEMAAHWTRELAKKSSQTLLPSFHLGKVSQKSLSW